MPFPDGTGTAGGPSPFDGTYTASVGVAPGVGPDAAPGVPSDDGQGWPDGLRPPSVAVDGLPVYVTDPNSFVPPPDAMGEDGGLAPIRLGRGAPGTYDVEAALRAQAEALALAAKPASSVGGADPKTKLCPQCGKQVPFKAKECPDCGYDWTASGVKLSDDGGDKQHLTILYGTGVPLALSAKTADANGWIWKVACKTGTLALSPGPGQVDLDVPLTLTDQDFADMVEAFDEKAFPYVTVPKTHANDSLENTGYVKALERLTKPELMADARIPQEGKDHVAGDPDETEYLLAGIHFTKKEALEAAQEGSIPDTSIGIKMGYRNKRSGKTFRRALEHLALTPVPWVDGLIPFNPSVALSGQAWDQREPGAPESVVLDGVYTEAPRQDLAMRIEQTGDDYDAVATRAALMALQPGDELSWNYDVRVERLQSGGGDPEDASEAYFLVRAPQNADPTDYGWDRRPTLYTDVESAMSAITTGVATCLQRRANERARMAAQTAGQDVPVMAKYAADGEAEGMNLAVFDENKHPRLHGKFAPKHGVKAETVAHRAQIVEEHVGKVEALKKGETMSVGPHASIQKSALVGKDSFSVHSKEGAAHAADAKTALAGALQAHKKAGGKYGEVPDAQGPKGHAVTDVQRAALAGDGDGKDAENATEDKADKLPADNGQALEQAFGDVRFDLVDSGPDDVSFTLPGCDDEEHDYQIRKGGPTDAVVTQAGPDDWVLSEYPLDAYDEESDNYDAEALTHHALGSDRDAAFKKAAKILKDRAAPGKPATMKLPPSPPADANGVRTINGVRYDRDGMRLSRPLDGEDTLSLSGAPGSLDGVTRHGAPGMPLTVEEILAQQQAAIEALQAELAEKSANETRLSAQVDDQGSRLHATGVAQKIRKLNGKYDPSTLVAAQAVMLADKPWERDEGGLNLSVVAPSAVDPAKHEQRELTSPTEIVEFMLSAMPTVDGQGRAAVQLAAINDGLDDLHLAAHRVDNAADPEAEARLAVDEWERNHKPHLFNPDGTRKSAA